MQLPKDSRNEQLESISLKKLDPLFPEEKFILKREFIDNGVDIRGEVKKDGLKYGFGFLLQLKSSESIKKNKDGTISKSIEVSNIEYLTNNAQPGYYCFYDDREERFYYKGLFDLIKELNLNNSNWYTQKSITIRFDKILDTEAIEKIYQDTFQEGFRKRKQSHFLTDQAHRLNQDFKLLIDEKGNTYSDIENILFIEKKGLHLNQDFKWKKVIEIHENISQTSLKSSTYYLTIAIAYFNYGNYFKSRIHLKKAERAISEIPSILIPHLKFYKLELDKFFGFTEATDYDDILSSPDIDSSLKNHLELDKIVLLKHDMYADKDFKSIVFEKEIDRYLRQSDLKQRFKFMGKLELNTYYADQFICLIPRLIRQNLYLSIKEQFSTINQKFSEIQREQLNSFDNESDIFILALRHFKFLIHFNSIAKYNFPLEYPENYWLDIEELLLKALSYFNRINHLENQLFSLQTLLEFYQLSENTEKENDIKEQLESFAEDIDTPYFRSKIQFILEGGTFVENVKMDFNSYKNELDEIKRMNAELKSLDEMDSYTETNDEGITIELFPIGYFFISNEKNNIFFKNILKITDKGLIKHIIQMGNSVIPILNIYILDIKTEGPEKGNLEYTGFPSHKNMYRIRKQLFENKIKRVKINSQN